MVDFPTPATIMWEDPHSFVKRTCDKLPACGWIIYTANGPYMVLMNGSRSFHFAEIEGVAVRVIIPTGEVNGLHGVKAQTHGFIG